MSNLKPPKPFESGKNPAEAWEKWRQAVEIYWIAADLETKPLRKQKAILLHILGEEALNLYNTFEFEIEGDEQGAPRDIDDVLTVEMILEAFSNHYTPFKNETYLRHLFFSSIQAEHQSIDEFVTELKTKARDCGFGALNESLIRDRIVGGIRSDKLRQKLLRTRDLNLATCINICHAEEEAVKQLTKMTLNTTSEVDEVKYKQFKQKQVSQSKKDQAKDRKYQKSQEKTKKKCNRCTYEHEYNKCPAMGQRCTKCNKLNHYAKACKSKEVHVVGEEADEENEEEIIDISAIYERQEINEVQVDSVNVDKEWFEMIKIGPKVIKFKLDTGSQVNIMPNDIFMKLSEQTRKETKLRQTDRKLVSYTNHNIKIRGICNLECSTKNGNKKLEFFIIEEKRQPLLGLVGIEELMLIKRIEEIGSTKNESKENSEKIGLKKCAEIIDDYEDVFRGIGCTKRVYKIKLKDNVEPTIARCRKIPIALHNKVKKQLEEMENQGIIKRVEEPTEWVHPMVVIEKSDGNLRLCMDPRPLNKYIQREHLELPTLETTLAKIKEAKYFTVLDASSAYHQIPLDQESSKICTISTPFGRYSYQRLPYGLSSASEVFQKEMNQIVEKVDGVLAYADDVLIYGSTIEEHNERLRHLLNAARENNMKFKKNKTQLAVKRILYLGHEISEEGIEISKDKVTAIQNMEKPNNKKELQVFLGMINYLSRFLPNMSKETEVLRNLLKNDTCWKWDSNEEYCFIRLKSLICEAPVLAFFDTNKHVTIAADASKSAIGGVLIQDDHPIAYCSATLTEAQKRYSVIEKELLAIVATCEHFHYFLYARDFKVLTDHKPLIGLVNKPIDDLSPRLQSLVLRLMKYRAKLEYIPGNQQYIPDALSRLKARNQKTVSPKIIVPYKVQSVLIASKERIAQIIDETKEDNELSQILYYIRNGWPRKLSSVGKQTKQYFNDRYEIYEYNGLIFKNTQLIIPKSLRQLMLEKIHTGHFGINSCIRRAQQSMYWPKMTEEITKYVSTCRMCQKHSKCKQKEPLQPHPIPNVPWEKIAIDFMDCKSKKYILIADYFSKFTIILPMETTKANDVIQHLKTIFGMYGLPTEIMTDNGPPFDSYVFKEYLKGEEIKHTTSSPLYPRSNGFIERQVQTFKNLLIKSPEEDSYNLMRIYNSTPKDAIPSPAEILMGRKIRANLPLTENANMKTLYIQKQLKNRQNRQKMYHDRTAKPDKEVGNDVLVQKSQKNWVEGKIIVKDNNPNSYWIKTGEGGVYRRNKIHIKNYNSPKHDVTIPNRENSPMKDTVVRNEDNLKEEIALKSSEAGATRRSQRSICKPLRFQDYECY